jgi:hypothetical protein
MLTALMALINPPFLAQYPMPFGVTGVAPQVIMLGKTL